MVIYDDGIEQSSDHSESMPINFRSKLHIALLRHYFANPRAEHFVRDLARILSFNGTHISRELRLLSRAGVFMSVRRGKEKYYRINKEHPLYQEFRKIVEHTNKSTL